jgi:hypothetical protein
VIHNGIVFGKVFVLNGTLEIFPVHEAFVNMDFAITSIHISGSIGIVGIHIFQLLERGLTDTNFTYSDNTHSYIPPMFY